MKWSPPASQNERLDDDMSKISALVVQRDAGLVKACEFPMADLVRFRLSIFNSDAKRVYPGAQSLSYDAFDNIALHILSLIHI